MKKRKIILHAHIFKNAGTTFDFSLRRSFGDGFVDHREDDKMLKGKQDYLEEFLDENPYVKAVSSHSIHFIPENNDRYKYFCIYILRHPIERMRSVYDFEKRQNTENLGARKAKELQFDEYVQWRMSDDVPATIRNCQTIFLSGEGPGADRVDEKFKLAMANMRNSLVGITHRYDESMIYFESKLKKAFPGIDLAYIRKNITDKNVESSLKEKINEVYKRIGDKRLKKLILDKNKFDIKIFKKADRILSSRVRRVPSPKAQAKDYENRLKAIHSKPAKPKNPSSYSQIEVFPKAIHQLDKAVGFGEYPSELAPIQKSPATSLFEASPAFGRITGKKTSFLDQADNPFGSKNAESFVPPLHLEQYGGSTLSVVSPGANAIYYHWMVDLIPKIHIVKKHFGGLDSFDRIIVNRRDKGFQKETLELLGINPNQIETAKTISEGSFEHLHTCNFSGTFRMTEVMKIWAELMPLPTPKKPTRRIYISREDSDRRNVTNETEIVTSLEKEGFEKVVLTGMTLGEQVDLFQECDFIISPHGASLTNLLWCQPGTRIIELFSQHIMPGYFNLARAKELDYHYFRCSTLGETPNTHLEKNAASFHVNVNALVEYIHQKT